MTQNQTVLLAWRKRMGWLQREAAEAFNVSLTTYQTWECEYRHSHPKGPFQVPKHVLLAAAAIENGLKPISNK